MLSIIMNEKTSVFIDESGIHKQDGQSTTALVYVESGNIEGLNKVILKAEKSLGIESFHWSKQIWKIRQAFLEAMVKEKFEVKIFVLQNPITEKSKDDRVEKIYNLAKTKITIQLVDGQVPGSLFL